ncbi:MAG: sugar phosphate isomerase/epimerase [Caldilineae bacterium]|nr:MAG: sugar phosphate isomerase/epimerase [Caldilineae bacterium]
MKVGVFSFVFQDLLSFDEALDWIAGVGAEAVEIGSGGYVAELGESYCKPAELLADRSRLRAWKKKVEDRGLEISALSCHGNPLHPDESIARRHREDFRDTVRVAAEIGVRRVVTFSGCPGDGEGSRYPNWVTCPWPPDFLRILEWQWQERVIPYWQEEVAFCREQGVDMIALEMHPGFVVYNPETLLRLREAVGPEIGANFDPSHLFWQNIDPLAAIRALGEAIFHVHAKDTRVDPLNTQVNGVLDTKPYADESNRSWIFRTVGYGHPLAFWKDLVSELRLAGYDYVLSMEHEDSLMSLREGLEKGVSALRQIVLTDERGKPWFEA